MKFARGFKESLAHEGLFVKCSWTCCFRTDSLETDFPAHWVQHAIPYGKLKKCLKQVQRELLDLGLDSETLRSLIDPSTSSPVALQYKLNSKFPVPVLWPVSWTFSEASLVVSKPHTKLVWFPEKEAAEYHLSKQTLAACKTKRLTECCVMCSRFRFQDRSSETHRLHTAQGWRGSGCFTDPDHPSILRKACCGVARSAAYFSRWTG
jgi:hypothetical protein